MSQQTLIQDDTHFRLDRELRRIYFKKDGHETLLNDIPSIDASYFYLRGKKQIVLEPEMEGNVGFYSYIYLESLSSSTPIKIKIALHPGNSKLKESRVLFQTSGSKVSFPLFKDLLLGKGDRLILQFQGRGIVYFSRPIIYLKSKKNRKQIYFIGVDTFRNDQIGLKVNGIPLTPSIDQFIQDAVYLDHTYAQTSWTLPSFMSLFTGLNEFNHEVGVKHPLSQDKPFLVEPLAKDFVTVGIHGGKVMDGRWGFSRGFDYYKKFQQAAALYPRGGESLFNKALEFIDQGGIPNLFMFLHTYQVHAPYTPPEEFLLQLNNNPKYKRIDLVNFNEPQKTFTPLPDDLTQSTKELYQAEIHAFDAFFGEFIRQLKKRGLYKNALIALMSDHGEEFFEHKGWGHSHSLYDELLHVPAIIKFPGNEFKNTRISNPTALMDLFPTLLEYLKLDYNRDALNGHSLMSLIKNPQHSAPDSSDTNQYVVSSISTGKYFEALPPRIAIMLDQYKLIFNQPFSPEDLAFFDGNTPPPQPPQLELYNTQTDPAETSDIANAQPQIRQKMFPVIRNIWEKIKRKTASQNKKAKPMDKEVKEQLKSLGYL